MTRFAAVESFVTTLNVSVSGTPGSVALVLFGPHVHSGRRLTTTVSEETDSRTYSPLPYDFLVKSAPGSKAAGHMITAWVFARLLSSSLLGAARNVIVP